jgi:pimeloyl-ACP methyl ester carboxylesterase
MPSPHPTVRALEAAATREVTPCGAGDLVWRRWPAAGPRTHPVVLVHGGSGSWTHWIRTIPALIEGGHEVWAVDLPGLGDSAMPPEPHTPATCARILAQGIDALFPTRTPHLIAFSWGAHVSTLAAVHLGERLASYTLAGSSALGLADAGLAPFPKLRSSMTDAERAEVHRRTLEILMIRDASRIDDLAIRLQADNIARARFRSADFARSDDISRALAGVDVPLAAIWGASDVLAVPSVEAVLPALQRHRRPDQAPIAWHAVADAGHWVMYEQPDAFNARLRAVLETRGSAP